MRKYLLAVLLMLVASAAVARENATVEMADSLYNVGRNLYKEGNYVEAIDWFKESAEVQLEVDGTTETEDYALIMYYLGRSLYNIGKYYEAIETGSAGAEIQKKVSGRLTTDYAGQIAMLCQYHNYVGDYQKALEIGKEAADIYEELYGKESKLYAIALNNIGTFYSGLGMYDKAIEACKEAMEIRRRILGTDSPDYAVSLNNLALYNSYYGNIKEAIRLGLESLEIQERTIGKDDPDYAMSLNNLAQYYAEAGDYDSAFRYVTEALEIRERVLGINHPDYSMSLSDLGLFNGKIGDYAEAIRLTKEALRLKEENFGKDHITSLVTLNNLAVFYYEVGNFPEAIRTGKKIMEIQKGHYGADNPDYALYLSNLAMYYSGVGDYIEAVKLGKEALEIKEKLFGREHPGYTYTLSNLALDLQNTGNLEEAIEIANEVVEIRARILGVDHIDYAKGLHNLAYLYAEADRTEEAISIGTESLKLKEKALGKEHPDYCTSLNTIGNYYAYSGDYDKAISLCREALKLKEKVIGVHNPDYSKSLESLVYSYSKSGNYGREFRECVLELNELNSEAVKASFSNLTSSERGTMWNTKKEWFDNDVNYAAYRAGTNDLIETGYNATLLGKGVLLENEKMFAQIIKDNADEGLRQDLKRLHTLRAMIDIQNSKTLADRTLDIDSLNNLVYKLELELLDKSKEYGDFTRNMGIGWREVKQNLKDNDVAIEFVNFHLDNDSIIYGAYVISNRMDTPAMVMICDKRDISAIPSSRLYKSNEFSRLVWEPLDKYIRNAENIYFAPTGEFYRIAIEALPHYGGEGLMADSYNIYRLTSTREIATVKDKERRGNAAVYGGLKYDLETSVLEEDLKRYPELRHERDFPTDALLEELDLRGGVAELPGTLVEADNIVGSMKKNGYRPIVYQGRDGTEASFKSLSGKNINLMHIATHGFYWTEKEARKTKDIRFLRLDNDNSARYAEDMALTRSGLLFAGANNALKGNGVSEDGYDGILTAGEISKLDFRGLDLVVMSACQTGLGEITGEGVFGLQRGFKKAGANSILMSLWKVDDRATQLLMSRFYEEFLSGRSKIEALKIAQNFVRNYEEETEIKTPGTPGADVNVSSISKRIRPFSDPKYWSAFILLDALD